MSMEFFCQKPDKYAWVDFGDLGDVLRAEKEITNRLPSLETNLPRHED